MHEGATTVTDNANQPQIAQCIICINTLDRPVS